MRAVAHSDYLIFAKKTMNASDALSAAVLRLQTHSPFWATLALFAERRITEAVPTAATDGQRLYFNPHFVEALSQKEVDGLLVHELLHAALLHVARRKHRQSHRWNLAADYVVNAMIMEEEHLDLPKGSLYDPAYANRDVEEVYELLDKDEEVDWQQILGGIGSDLLDNPIDVTNDERFDKEASTSSSDQGGDDNDRGDDTGQDGNPDTDGNNDPEKNEANSKLKQQLVTENKSPETLKTHWENALRQAAIIQETQHKGNLPAGITRIVKDLDKPQLDWRTLLWRYLVRTPTDYGDFDRRHMHSGLYLEGIDGERLRVFICIDTSGSISNQYLGKFLTEVRGILSGYAHVEVTLYFCDASLSCRHKLSSVTDEMPTPEGGGGTDFRPFFKAIEEESDPFGEFVAIYLTDGYGHFPDTSPNTDVLWVVVPGGLDDDGFPFGNVVRMLG